MLYIDVTRLINNQQRGKRATGVDRVCLAYVQYFSHMACAMIQVSKQWLFFPQNKSKLIFEQLLENTTVELPLRIFRFRYRKPESGNNFLLNTGHNGLEKPEFRKKMSYYGLRGIYFLHDLIPIDYPEYCRVSSYQQHQQRLLTMSDAALVICNSNDVYNRFIKYCEDNKLRIPKTIWTHLGITNTFVEQKQKISIDFSFDNQPFFLMIGTIEGRKNHWLILNVWKSLIQELGKSCPKLVIVGKRGWECEQVFAMLDRSISLKDFVVELNECSDEHISYLMYNTRALLFPSNAEGFGLPLLEALSMKVPVIASDIAIFREICFEAGILLSPIDGEVWKKMIIEFTFSETLREEQIQKINAIQGRLPTWKEHFNKVSSYVRQLMYMG